MDSTPAVSTPLHDSSEQPPARAASLTAFSARRWPPLRVLALVTLVVTAAVVFWVLHPHLLLRNTIPTGGDTGAQVLLPAVVRDSLLPSGRIMGWSNAWYAGAPMLYFYFPLPVLTVVLLDVFIPYGVAFKLVTVAGLVALPFAAYYFVRSMRFTRPIATIAAVSGTTFIFMESNSIFGGNIPSTLAGEYTYSWSFALSLVYLGLVIKAVRAGRRFSLAAGVVLALTALTHLVTTMVVVAAVVPLMLRRDGWKPVVGSWVTGFSLAAFWAIPLLLRVGYTTDMGWEPVTAIIGAGINGSAIPRELLPFLVLGSAGLLWSLLRRYDTVVAVWLALVPLSLYLFLPYTGYTKLYNARFLPYWYFTLFLFAGVLVGMGLVELARRLPSQRTVLLAGTAVACAFFLLGGLVGISFIRGWARWNYEGYEGKGTYAEYAALMEAVDSLPPGRVMWEYNREMDKYGTPMALMLTPLFAGDHPSMEGLYFESSLTTPFHFLNQAELSEAPSQPVRGLTYRRFDFDRGIAHLDTFNVRYYVTYTEAAYDVAVTRPELTELQGLAMLEGTPFAIFELQNDLVDVGRYEPSVYIGDEGFLAAALDWYDDVENLDKWLVADGPDIWPRADDRLLSLGTRPIAGNGTVSNVEVDDHRIAFTTTAVGVPHLVKVSYFPNWAAKGAEGPFRAAPSLMVVVPTEENVEITFDRTADEWLGLVLTFGALGGLVVHGLRRRRAAS